MTYEQTTQWLFGLHRFGIRLGLENIRALLEALDHPERRAPVILVAGTNGKGSVAALTSSVLGAHGLRVGTFTSPHLVRFEERIQVDSRPLAPERVVELARRVRAVIKELMDGGRLPYHPTYFEVTTSMAWLAFAEAGVELAVVEVGLGGRFDATNASEPLVSVITCVDLEHTRWLGPTVEAIATEKAGVMRAGRPVVTGSEDARVLEVLASEAASRGARLVRAGQGWKIQRLEPDRHGCWLELETPCARYGPMRLPLAGRHQVGNALVALAALEELEAGLRPGPATVATGFAATRWPGRLEAFGGTPRMLLDGAHNPHASASLADYLREFEPGSRTLVFASLEDKDVGSMAKRLFPLFARIVLTKVDFRRALDAQAILRYVPPRSQAAVAADTPSALETALGLTPEEGLIVVAGSLYLVGEARVALEAMGREPVVDR